MAGRIIIPMILVARLSWPGVSGTLLLLTDRTNDGGDCAGGEDYFVKRQTLMWAMRMRRVVW